MPQRGDTINGEAPRRGPGDGEGRTEGKEYQGLRWGRETNAERQYEHEKEMLREKKSLRNREGVEKR